MASDSIDARLHDVAVSLVAPDVALVTYVSEVVHDGVQRA